MALNEINRNDMEASKTSVMLNQLLATLQVHRQNLHASHWGIRGRNFFELHELFGEYYNEALAQIDDVAERILQLGYTPLSKFSEYTSGSKIIENGFVSDEAICIQNIIDDLKILLGLERKILARASELLDEGTFRIMSNLVGESEKKIWMLTAYQGKSV